MRFHRFLLLIAMGLFFLPQLSFAVPLSHGAIQVTASASPEAVNATHNTDALDFILPQTMTDDGALALLSAYLAPEAPKQLCTDFSCASNLQHDASGYAVSSQPYLQHDASGYAVSSQPYLQHDASGYVVSSQPYLQHDASGYAVSSQSYLGHDRYAFIMERWFGATWYAVKQTSIRPVASLYHDHCAFYNL